MKRPWIFALCASVCLWPFGTLADPPVGLPSPRVSAANLAEEHARLLDTHNWDRSSPEVLLRENELTSRALEVSQNSPSGALDELLARLAGDPLGASLRALPRPPAELVAAYLARHHDPALLAYAQSTVPYGALAQALARQRLTEASPMLWRAITQGGREDREHFCSEATNLPFDTLRELSERLVPSLTPLSTDLTGSLCVSLLARSSAGLTALARHDPGSAGASGPASQALSTEVALGLLLEAHGRHARASELLGAALGQSTTPMNDWRLEGATELSVIAPALDGEGVGLRRALRRTVQALGFYRWGVIPLRLRMRDAELGADASLALRANRVDRELAEGYVMALALTSPRGSTAPARELLGSLRGASGVDILAAQLDLWRDALEATDRCGADDLCLARMLTDATDETAARAAFVLGDRGLAGLGPARARAAARRVVIRSAPWLAASLSVTLRGCPRSMRSLASATAGALPELRALRFEVYLRELALRCAR